MPTERECRFSNQKQGRRRGNADLAGGSEADGEEMQIWQAEARPTERKCRFSSQKHGRRTGNTDLAGGSKADGEEMPI